MTPDKPVSIPLPSRDSVTALQVSTLLQIAGTMNAMLHHANEHSIFDAEDATVSIRDGGTVCAIESTLIGACSQIDAILGDANRWTLNSQGKLEKKLGDVYDANLRFLKLQTEAVRQVGLPHRMRSPTLVRLDDGQWAAVLGDITKPGQSIIGVGHNPDEAMKDFDKIYLGKAENATIVATDSIIEHENLDERTEPSVDNPPPRGEDELGNSEAPGQE